MIVISMQEPVLAQGKFPVRAIKSVSKIGKGRNMGRVPGIKVRPIVPIVQQNRRVTPVIPLADSSVYHHNHVSNPAFENLRALRATRLEPYGLVLPKTFPNVDEVPTLRPSLVETTKWNNNLLILQIQSLQNGEKQSNLILWSTVMDKHRMFLAP